MNKNKQSVTNKRILMILQNNPYPQDVRVRREAETLSAIGYRVCVISPKSKGQPLIQTIEDVTVYRFPAYWQASSILGYLVEYCLSMIALFVLSLYVFVRIGFDIIHVHNPPDTLVLIALFYKIFGRSLVFDHHDIAPEMYQALFGQKKLIYKILLLFEKLSCRSADLVITTNETYKNLEIERNDVDPERIVVVRNGPDLKYLQPVIPLSDLRPTGKCLICYVGSMGNHDGLDFLLRALQFLVLELDRRDFFCILVGGGNAQNKLVALSLELGLENYVTFTGYIPHILVPEYLAAADICIAPEPYNAYNNQSTMIKITEYMSMGKPIVAFDLKETRVSAQNAALYASPNSVEDFATKIKILMDDADLRRQLGEIGRNRISNGLAWSFQAERLIDAYCTSFPV